MLESPSSVTSAHTGDHRFLDHLSSAADLVGARRFREAEVDVLRALSIAPSDLRALKLLGLVRFKLGRLDEARAVCREIAATLPRDAGIRLKLGLIALKLDRLDESVQELEQAARLAPDDLRTWSYLGFAYARRGEGARAAASFRRAGQESLAGEVETSGAAPGPMNGAVAAAPVPGAVSGVVSGAPPESAFDPSLPSSSLPSSSPILARPPRADWLGGGEADFPGWSLSDYVGSRLAPATDAASRVGVMVRLTIGDEAFVRGDAAVACTGTARWEPALRHVRGRVTTERLYGDGDEHPFFRLRGSGHLFVGAPLGNVVLLRLTDDILYVREDRVLAFEGTVSWECGQVPRGGIRMLQFRGRGLIAIGTEAEPGAVRVTPEHPVLVSGTHLLGWVGRVVAWGADELDTEAAPNAVPVVAGPLGITCEGEGVVLLDAKRRGRS